MMKLVKSKSIQHCSIHRQWPLQWHIYALPFTLIAYPIAVDAMLRHPEMADYRFPCFLILLTVHALLFLLTKWSSWWLVRFTSWEVHDPQQATHILLIPAKHRGSSCLCPLQHSKEKIWFEFHHKKYRWNAEERQFEKLDYPIHELLGVYKQQKYLSGISQVEAVRKKYGWNHFDIPLPTFSQLMQEQVVAPFFVFQVFSVALWLMDEYWYYSLFTLCMLFVFESTVVHQRLRSLRELRSMAQAPFELSVYRNQQWEQIKSDHLVPGDVVSVVRGKSDDTTVPCDILLLDGHCIVNEAMLSGESTPLLKESIQLLPNEMKLNIKSNDFKPHLLFAGTKVLQETGPTPETTLSGLTAPDQGCIGIVLRTGFGTAQGKLVRTMVFNTERVSANNMESLLFILFLLCFAIVAAWHVWEAGLANGRKKGKLILDCIIILTSVVPPELPMELSLAVNQSLMALIRQAIFCTEPFRIPFAGKVDVLCFDKTGTLTGENLVIEGIAGVRSKMHKLKKPTEMAPPTTLTVAACQSVVMLDDGLIGDPMEKTVLDAMQWTVSKNDKVFPKDKGGSAGKPCITILRKFPFSSALKRMATVSSVDLPAGFFTETIENSNGKKDVEFDPLAYPLESKEFAVSSSTAGRYLVAVKGAPEVLRSMYKSIPDNFDETYKHFAMNGSRVLALGIKWITGPKHQVSSSSDWVRALDRDSMEKDLTFCGFLIFHCPLKPDTASAICELHESMHRIIMITGDNALTACHVAKELLMIRRPVLIIESRGNNTIMHTIDESKILAITDEDLHLSKADVKFAQLFSEYDFCITGHALQSLENTNLYEKVLLPRIFVYARVSPSQKEYALTCLKNAGYITLMCGDGTNDVGALKQSHVGVALLNGTKEDLDKIAEAMRARRIQEFKKKQEEMYKAWGITPPADGQNADPRKQQQQRMVKNLLDNVDQLDEVPTLKFGDASVAAPFTSKIGSIHSICNIIRQGRCTLVTTIQMYKILALNCLITAFSLSALYLDGIKYGDNQVTLQGFLLAGCFLFLSWGKPIQKLSRQRPQPNIFNWYILLSVLGQFAVHSFSLWQVVTETKLHMPPDWKPDLDPESKFEPSLLNSAVFLISLSMQVSTFLINYQGRPFRESLRENRPLYLSLSGLLSLAVFGAGEAFPELNTMVEIVPFPAGFSDFLVKSILLDLAASYGVEYVCNKLFSDSKPQKSLQLDDAEWESLGTKNAENLVVRERDFKKR